MPSNIEWHVDGHGLKLRIYEGILKASPLPCPVGDDSDAPCYSESVEKCGIVLFLELFGLALNVGECDPAPEIEIAWTHNGWKEWSLYDTAVQIIPVTDPVFQDWLMGQKQL